MNLCLLRLWDGRLWLKMCKDWFSWRNWRFLKHCPCKRNSSKICTRLKIRYLLIYCELAVYLGQLYLLFCFIKPKVCLFSAFWRVFPSISIFPLNSKVCLFLVFWQVFVFPSISIFQLNSKVCLFSVFWRVLSSLSSFKFSVKNAWTWRRNAMPLK